MPNRSEPSHGGNVASPNESNCYAHPSPQPHQELTHDNFDKPRTSKVGRSKKSDEHKQKGKRRNRRTLSCENCRARKTRCTREEQCHQCTLRGTVCQWGPKSVKWFPRRSGQFDNAKRSTQLAANQDAIEDLKSVANRLGELLSIEQPRMDALLQPPTSFTSFSSHLESSGNSEFGERENRKEDHSDTEQCVVPPMFAHLPQPVPGSPGSSHSSHYEYERTPRYNPAFSEMLYVDQEDAITSYLDTYNGGPALYYPRYNFQGLSATPPVSLTYGEAHHHLHPHPYYANWGQ